MGKHTAGGLKLNVRSLKVKACDKSHDSSKVAVVSVKYCGLYSGPIKLNQNQDCMSNKTLTNIVRFSG